MTIINIWVSRVCVVLTALFVGVLGSGCDTSKSIDDTGQDAKSFGIAVGKSAKEAGIGIGKAFNKTFRTNKGEQEPSAEIKPAVEEKEKAKTND